MSLQLAAQHMASRGRGPDTTLVHMAPQEVAGLQALAKAHGGSLTVNPDTGLPEAGFLSSILPMVIGGALAATGVGAPLAAAMVGGGYGLATGSLSKGLMAGLGAYGGAGLAGGLMSAGAAGGAGAAGAAGAGASEMAATNAALQQNALTGVGVDSAVAAGTGSMSFAPGMSTNVLGTAPVAGPMSVPVPTSQLAAGVPQVATATPMAATTPTFSDSLSQMGQGFKSLGTEAGRDAFMSKEGVGGLGGLLKYGYAAGMPLLMQEPKAVGEKPKEEPYRYSYDPGRVSDPNAGYTGAPTGERTYFNPVYTRTAAGGGLMDIGPVQAMSDRNAAQTLMANGGQMLAEGGQSNLGDYSDGGRLLRGPGDGVSDSIPASIGDKRPARLADGEFVVPARIVSELGNGSTEAGARKLYAMMDRVQSARKKSIGKDRVAVNSRSEKLLPA